MEGKIITFYSYKGGVGRSMALANIAVLMKRWGYNVLMLDWDLEAPGLENFFKDYISLKEFQRKEGIVDLLLKYTENNPIDWRDVVQNIPFESNQKGRLDLITAGLRHEEYFANVRKFDFNSFYTEHAGGAYIEILREQWKTNYDFVLVDSRTGVTDIGGVCTVQLPDIVVLLFTATEQSLQGILRVGKKINESLKKLPVERYHIPILPIPSRFENLTEFKIGQEWLERFSKDLLPLVEDWLPEEYSTPIRFKEIIEILKIPYIPYFSFGEKIPVIEQGTSDSSGLGYSYENITAFVVNELSKIENFFISRESYINQVDINNKKIKLYLSYSWANEDLIREFMFNFSISYSYEILNAKIFDVQPGINWRTIQQQNIEDSDLLICFVTKQYIDSNAALAELQHASLKNRLIVPVYFQGLSSKLFRFNFEILQNLAILESLHFNNKINFNKINQLIDKIIHKIVVNVEVKDKSLKILVDRKFFDVNWDSMHHNKLSYPKNEKDSIKLLMFMAEQGDLECQLYLGEWYMSKDIIDKHLNVAKKWYLLACEQKSPVAYYKMGLIYEQEKDYKNAVKYYRFASYHGVKEAEISINRIQK